MRFNVGDIIYDGGGNIYFCTFIKCRIKKIVAPHYYVVEVLEDYGSIWDKPRKETAVIGSLQDCFENSVFKTYEQAKKNLYKDMNFKSDRDFILAYFNR